VPEVVECEALLDERFWRKLQAIGPFRSEQARNGQRTGGRIAEEDPRKWQKSSSVKFFG